MCIRDRLHTGQTCIVFTPTNDRRALRPAEIGFFRYCSERKQWEVILNNHPPLVLRRGMTAEQITQYSSSFVQIHQSYLSLIHISTGSLPLISEKMMTIVANIAVIAATTITFLRFPLS